MITGIGHVGILVRDLNKAVDLYCGLFGLEPLTEVIDWPGEGMKNIMLKVGNQAFEVMEPTDPQGSLARFLEQRGEGLHHINLEVSDLDSLVESLQAKGATVLGRGPGFCFLHPKSAGGILFELIQSSK
jgi:methylmalonyl-CoA/ethylmalonyl-CoA epimerase